MSLGAADRKYRLSPRTPKRLLYVNEERIGGEIMKARIKEAGEVLKVADFAVIAMEHCDSHGNPLEYKPEEVELTPDTPDTPAAKEIDWEQRRWELVKAILQALYANEKWNDTQFREVAKIAIKQADAVLAEYRKGDEE